MNKRKKKKRYRIVERFLGTEEIRFVVEVQRGDGEWVKIAHRWDLDSAILALNQEKSRPKRPRDKVVYKE